MKTDAIVFLLNWSICFSGDAIIEQNLATFFAKFIEFQYIEKTFDVFQNSAIVFNWQQEAHSKRA